MERKKASDFPQGLLNLFDAYVHGGIEPPRLSRWRAEIRSRRRHRRGAVRDAAAELRLGHPGPAGRPAHQRASRDRPFAAGQRDIKGYLARPATSGKLPAVLVVHENRGLNPYIEDVARRLALADFIAFAPDGLTSVGGYPGDDEKGARAVQPGRPGEDDGGFPCRGRVAESAARTAPASSARSASASAAASSTAGRAHGRRPRGGGPFYGAQPTAADAAKIKAPIKRNTASSTRGSLGGRRSTRR